jgi:hypothetical protein
MEAIYQRLVALGEPSIHVVEMTEDAFHTWHTNLRSTVPQAVVRVLQGKQLSTRDTFFAHFAVAFQFPHYFGNNWDAFNDCIHDLYRSGKSHVLLVSGAARLLTDRTHDDLRHLLEILQSHHQEWSESVGDTTDSQSTFHVVLQEDHQGFTTLTDRLTALGIAYEVLTPA